MSHRQLQHIVLFAMSLTAQSLCAQTADCPGDDSVEGVLWAIADDGADAVYVTGNGGVTRSCDGGSSFTAASPPLRPGLSVLVDPLDPAIIYFGTDQGIYRSTDFGVSFSVTGANVSGLIFGLGAQSGGAVFAGADNAIYRSDDDGNTWTVVAATGASVRAFAVSPTNDQIIYAGTNGDGLYESLDGGENWSPVGNGNAQWQIRDLEFDPSNPATLYAPSWDGIWRSVDAGANWTNLGSSRVVDMDFDPNDASRAYVATWDSGVLRSTDGGTTWSPVNAGLPTNRLYSLQVLASGRVLVGTEFEGLFSSDDGGTTWGLAGAPIPAPTPIPTPTPGYASLSAEITNLMGGSVQAGAQARFRITITNDGPDTSTDSSANFAWFRSTLLNNTGQNYTLTTSQGSCVRSVTATPDCTIGTLAAGASVVIEFSGDTQPNALGTYTLRVFTNNNESAGGQVAEETIGSILTVLDSDGGGGGQTGLLSILLLSLASWCRMNQRRR